MNIFLKKPKNTILASLRLIKRSLQKRWNRSVHKPLGHCTLSLFTFSHQILPKRFLQKSLNPAHLGVRNSFRTTKPSFYTSSSLQEENESLIFLFTKWLRHFVHKKFSETENFFARSSAISVDRAEHPLRGCWPSGLDFVFHKRNHFFHVSHFMKNVKKTTRQKARPFFFMRFLEKNRINAFLKKRAQNFEFFKELEKPIGLRLRPFQNSVARFVKTHCCEGLSPRPQKRPKNGPHDEKGFRARVLGRATRRAISRDGHFGTGKPSPPKTHTPNPWKISKTPKRRPLTVQPSAPPKTTKTYTIPFPPRQTT